MVPVPLTAGKRILSWWCGAPTISCDLPALPLEGTTARDSLQHKRGGYWCCRAVRSLLDTNRSGRAGGVRRLPQIWQKAPYTMRTIILEECNCVYLR
jgi:hypothetical protein